VLWHLLIQLLHFFPCDYPLEFDKKMNKEGAIRYGYRLYWMLFYMLKIQIFGLLMVDKMLLLV
jgi:hypothetical protein